MMSKQLKQVAKRIAKVEKSNISTDKKMEKIDEIVKNAQLSLFDLFELDGMISEMLSDNT